jgi:hypothetical protein
MAHDHRLSALGQNKGQGWHELRNSVVVSYLSLTIQRHIEIGADQNTFTSEREVFQKSHTLVFV